MSLHDDLVEARHALRRARVLIDALRRQLDEAQALHADAFHAGQIGRKLILEMAAHVALHDDPVPDDAAIDASWLRVRKLAQGALDGNADAGVAAIVRRMRAQ